MSLLIRLYPWKGVIGFCKAYRRFSTQEFDKCNKCTPARETCAYFKEETKYIYHIKNTARARLVTWRSRRHTTEQTTFVADDTMRPLNVHCVSTDRLRVAISIYWGQFVIICWLSLCLCGHSLYAWPWLNSVSLRGRLYIYKLLYHRGFLSISDYWANEGNCV